ncbi:hypothetical protein GIB67_013138, partial [Kingdonia uniflora]
FTLILLCFQMNFSPVPQWLEVLLGEKFFNPCLVHESLKKNEKNIFCLDCCCGICTHCLTPHRSHRLLQIRRYVYHDVVRAEEIGKLIDCSYVQSYTTNSAKVVFLNQRPQARPFRGAGSICSTCERSLQDPYLFCSLCCKVQHLVKSKEGISKYLYECEFLPLSEGTKGETSFDIEDGQLTPDSILESPALLHTSSGSSSGGNAGIGEGIVLGCRAYFCAATTVFVRKKRSSLSAVPRNQYRPCSPTLENTVNMTRRKGIPHRSPLY